MPRPTLPRASRSAQNPLIILLLFAAIERLTQRVNAFWRLPCQGNGGSLVTQRADPLTNPGAISGHVHAISGGSNFNLDMNFDTARDSACTSCRVKQDMSNYWTPALSFAWANGSFTMVDQVGLLVYYLQRFNKDDEGDILAFPAGFRMLAGNPYLRSYNESNQMATQIGCNCLGGDKPTRRPELLTNNCPNGLRLEHIQQRTSLGRVPALIRNASSRFSSRSCGASIRYRTTGTRLQILDSHSCSRWATPLAMGYTETSSTAGMSTSLRKQSMSAPPTRVTSRTALSSTYTITTNQTVGCNPIDYGAEDVTVCSEDNPPSLLSQINIFGGLANGNSTIDVATTSTGGSSSGSSSGGGGSSGSGSNASGGGSASASSKASSATSGSSGSGSSGGGSGGSSSGDSSSSSSSSATSEGDLKLWVGLVGGGSVLLCIIICLSCRFQCGRRRTWLDQQIPPGDEEARRHQKVQKGLQGTSSRDSSDGSDTDSDSSDDSRVRKR
ncbi:hypothetical protein JCM11641_003812 [Rhodosporidiobolus odoratus]